MSDRYLASIPKLNGENYHDWKFAVSMALRQKDAWAVISGKEPKERSGANTREAEKAWEKKAEEGFSIIALTVEPSQYTYIRDCANGVEAWTKLKEIYEKNSRSTRISLKRQFYGFKHDTSAPIRTYITGITELAAKLKAIGIQLTDEEITDVLIFNLDAEYSNVAASLMTKESLTISDVTSTLIEEERRAGKEPQTETTTLMSTSQKCGQKRDRRENFSKDTRKCYRCGRIGHIAQYCHATKTADGKEISAEKAKDEDKAAFAIDDWSC